MTYRHDSAFIQINALMYIITGIIIFFVLYSILAINEHPLVTFISSFISGLLGLIICSKWIIATHLGKRATVFILLAYTARIIVGLLMYLNIDPGYFEGNGTYIYDYGEYFWTYDNAIRVANSVLLDNVYLPSNISKMDEDKNAYIHTWMGYFLAFGRSDNALDLTPFNAFHHAIAGYAMISISLSLRYSLHTALLAGIATAWIPWGFPASIMWRDSVGLAWVTLAIMLLIIGNAQGIVIKLLILPIAIFLAYSDRTIYSLLILLSAVYLYTQSKNINLLFNKRISFVYFIKIIFIMLLFVPILSLIGIGNFGSGGDTINIGSRVITIPLLIIRGIAGPFPWVDIDDLFNYAFHVFQLAIFIVIGSNYKNIRKNDGFLFLTAVFFWLIGILAVGVHTAYLAVAMPFLLPIAFSMKKNINLYICISLAFFIVFNILYLASGLHGNGILLGTTGY